MSRFWRMTGVPTLLRNSSCNLSFKRNSLNLSQPHVYKKIWTEDELIQYLRNNIIYESDKKFISSLPVGIGTAKDMNMSHTPDITLTELAKKLKFDFPSRECYIVRYPRRSASGLTLFAKTRKVMIALTDAFQFSFSQGALVFGYLAVVMGQPDQIFTKDFGIRFVETDAGVSVMIRDVSLASKKFKRVSYQHEVLCSTDEVSLVKVEVSTDFNDTALHILAHSCLTPVFGDSWNYRRKQSFMFGVPLVRDTTLRNLPPYVLPPELLKKVQLEPGEEKFIPPHLHLYSLKLPLKQKSELFASVPPPEHFIWTCKQLGLHAIERFSQTELERSEVSVG